MARNFARVMAAALFAVAVWGCDGNLGVDELVKRAEAHRAEGKPRAGIIELKNALQENPDSVAARLLLAELSLQVGDPFSAEKELLWARDKAERAAVEPSLARAWLALGKAEQVLKETAPKPEDSAEIQAALLGLRGQAYLATARLAEAEAELAKGKALDPDAPQVLAGEAQLAWRRKDLAAARKLADEAARGAPLDYGIASLRADLLLAAGEPAEAEKAWREVAKLSDNSMPARLGIARAEVAQKKYAEAIKELDAILKVAPSSPAASYFRALAAYMTKDYGAAKAFSEKALVGASNHMPSVLVAGASSYALEQYEQANRYLQRYVAEIPENAEARALLAQTLIRMGQPASARKTLEAGLRENPDDVKLLALVGSVAAQTGDLRASGNYLQKAVSLEPDNPQLRARLGATKIALGEEEGIDELEKAVEIDPNLTQAEVALVVAELRARKFEEALERAKGLQGKAETEAAGYFFAGVARVGLRDFDQAERDFEKTVELRPQYVPARTNLAMLAAQRRDFDLARDRLKAILADHPDRLDTLLRLSTVERAANRLDEAEKWLVRAVEAHPDSAEALLSLSRLQLVTGKAADALSTAKSAREKFPQEPAFLEVAGNAQLALGQAKDAVETFRSLVALRPDIAQSHLLLARAYAAASDRENHRKSLESALAAEPKNLLARIGLARLALGEQNLSQAVALAGELKRDFPSVPAVQDLLGDVAMAQNRPAEALSSYRSAWEAAPNSAATTKLARAQWLAGDRDGSLAFLERWVSEHPQDNGARTTLVGEYLELERFPDAKKHLATLVEAAPNSAIVHNDLAWVLYKLNEREGALKHAKRAIELAPDNPMVMDTLGTILLAENQTREALRLIRTAAERVPGNPTIQYHLALALSQSGEGPAARDLLQRILREKVVFPERAEAEALLERLGGQGE